jgi:hypothetical protein
VQCLTCGHALAFDEARLDLLTLSRAEDGLWREAADGGAVYRLCANYADHAVCNWAIPVDSPESLCRACSLTRTIPSLDSAANREAWAKLEGAKRRMVYTILRLGLPLVSKVQDPAAGVIFDFLSDARTANGDQSRVLTGHDDGVITINVAEADDVYRESQRQHQNEPYRTLLGHFRHEIGHFYWDRLIRTSPRLTEFRAVFGDERLDYGEALRRHYADGAPANWAEHHVSAYATTHPWEDWAESWAHVMHMVDALETAHALGLQVKPERRDEPALSLPSTPVEAGTGDFDHLARAWASLTYVLNNLTRGLGLSDAYPFVLSGPVVEKLRFVWACTLP